MTLLQDSTGLIRVERQMQISNGQGLVKQVRGVTAIIPTYNRPEILSETIARLIRFVQFDGQLSILVGDDSEEWNLPETVLSNRLVRVIAGPRNGLGANLNMLLREAETDVVLQMDDDHWLNSPLDISQYIHDLRTGFANIGWIRLFLGENEDMYNLKTYYKFVATNHGPYWFPIGNELYIASNRPHLKLKSFHVDHFGFYDEGLRLGKTEEMFCHRYNDERKKESWPGVRPWITIPMTGLSHQQWSHVGGSWQKKGL